MKKVGASGLVFLLVMLSGTADAATYYVSPTGSNSDTGTVSQPWATPGYGSRKLQPGDTLIILGGQYVLSLFGIDDIVPRSGTSGAWITIKGEAGKRPVLAGRDDLYAAVILSGRSYIRLENLEITHDDTVSGQKLWFRGAWKSPGNRPAT